MEGIIFVGIQASGKSSFFLKTFYATHLRLNMDMLKTRNREAILLNACIEAKQPVVIDNTNPTRKDREKYITALKQGRFRVVGYYFQAKLNECIARNKQREGKQKIPEVGIKGTYKKLEKPTFTEGFDELYTVTLINDYFVVEQWQDEI